MAYRTQRLKGLQKKVDTLKMREIETEQRLEMINLSIKKRDLIIKQEQDRIQMMEFGEKNKAFNLILLNNLFLCWEMNMSRHYGHLSKMSSDIQQLVLLQ